MVAGAVTMVVAMAETLDLKGEAVVVGEMEKDREVAVAMKV